MILWSIGMILLSLVALWCSWDLWRMRKQAQAMSRTLAIPGETRREGPLTGRHLSDDALLHELAGFLAYEYRERDAPCLVEWMDTKGFVPADRSWLEATYTVATELES